MKNLCFTLFLIIFCSGITAQTDKNQPVKNIKYVDEVVSNVESNKIGKIQTMIANYNLENLDIYDSSEKSKYDVVFNETQCKIKVTYNSDGKILYSDEIYSNMRLPMSLVNVIINQYNNWSIINNEQQISYDLKKGTKKVYKVTITKDKELKTLIYKMDTKSNNKSYVALN